MTESDKYAWLQETWGIVRQILGIRNGRLCKFGLLFL